MAESLHKRLIEQGLKVVDVVEETIDSRGVDKYMNSRTRVFAISGSMVPEAIAKWRGKTPEKPFVIYTRER